MEKLRKHSAKLLAFVLVCIAISGVFDQSAFNYIKTVAGNNVEFLAIVSEVKMIINGVGSIKIPFISGHTEGLSTSLNKVENYLLVTDAIAFIQLMLFAVIKTWIFKIGLLILFVVSILERKTKHLFRILILVLALSPGLSIYTTIMHKMYDAAAIDYGTTYLQELDSTMQKVKQENLTLMREHSKQIAQIDSSKHASKLFEKLKADVAYDIKKVGNSVSGDYKEIRTLIKNSGHIITTKVSRFCSMVLFSLLLMPIGYAFLILALYNSLFKKVVTKNTFTAK